MVSDEPDEDGHEGEGSRLRVNKLSIHGSQHLSMNLEIETMAIKLPTVARHPNRLTFRGVLTVNEVRRMRGLPQIT